MHLHNDKTRVLINCNRYNLFCSTSLPVFRAGWVQSTFKSLFYALSTLTLSSAGCQLTQQDRNKSPEPWFNPGLLGEKQVWHPLWYAAPYKHKFLLLFSALPLSSQGTFQLLLISKYLRKYIKRKIQIYRQEMKLRPESLNSFGMGSKAANAAWSFQFFTAWVTPRLTVVRNCQFGKKTVFIKLSIGVIIKILIVSLNIGSLSAAARYFA